MERNQFNIDRLLRSKLSRPVAGPDNDARNSMEQMLREAAREKRHRRGGFWWFIAIIGIGVASAGIWATSHFAGNQKISSESNQEESDAISQNQNIDTSAWHQTAQPKNSVYVDTTLISNGNPTSSSPSQKDLKSLDDAKVSAQNKTNSPATINDHKKTKSSPNHSTKPENKIGASNNQSSEKDKSSENQSNTGEVLSKEYLAPNEKNDYTSDSTAINSGDPIKQNDSTSTSGSNQITDENKTVASGIDSIPDSLPKLAIDSISNTEKPVDSLLKKHIAEKARSWFFGIGASWSRFMIQRGDYFTLSDREEINYISGFSPDIFLGRTLNKFMISAGYSTFKFDKTLQTERIDVADGEYIIVDDEITTNEYYDTLLDNQLRDYRSINQFKSQNIRMQLGYHILPHTYRTQITPSVGFEYQKSIYQELSYRRIGFYQFIQGSDPLLDYYTIWFEPKTRQFSNVFYNGLASVNITRYVGRQAFISFEPMIHYPLFAKNKEEQQAMRFDLRLTIGIRLFKSE